jgi:hypothetical protein
MKKLLLLFVASLAFTTQAQDSFFSTDCESYTLGNISTDLTATTAGQGGWYTYTPSTASPAGTLSDFQVVSNTVSNSKAIQITGTSGPSGTRFLYQDIASAWTNRTTGNDVIQVEYDFFSGSGVTTSKNTFRTYIYNYDGTNLIAVAGYFFDPATLKLSGWAYYDNAGTPGYYTFNLITGGLILTANTWYRIGVAYDYNTGAVTWKDENGLFYGGVTAASTGVDLTEVDFAVASGSVTGGVQNAAANQFLIDNVSISAVATENLLGTNTNVLSLNDFSVFPNPTKDIVNVSNSSASINSIEVTDLNGRVVKTVNAIDASNSQLNISDLSSGVYMMKIVSDQGTTTKKVVKE